MPAHPTAISDPTIDGAQTKPKRGQRETSSRRGADISPAMRQYLEQKRQVGEAILLFRMGDFYETFNEDAKTIARVLGLTLTTRDKNSPAPIPLAGVPYHAVDRYVARLVRAGFKVAISEQMEEAKPGKGVVDRKVVRIITPGTLTDDALMDEQRENYLAALFPAETWSAGHVGLACVSLGSGQFFAQMIPAASLLDELLRLGPAEVLLPESSIDETGSFVEELRQSAGAAVTFRPPHAFDAHMAEATLCRQLGASSLAGFGFDRFDASLCAAGAALDYLRETQKSALAHILKLEPRTTNRRVILDPFTLRSLEVERSLREGGREGSLLAAIDMTAGAMGARLLREWLCYPLTDVAAIRSRQGAIGHLREPSTRLQRIRKLIGQMGDIERVLGRLGVRRASPRDLVGLGRALMLCGQIAEAIAAPTRDDIGDDDQLSHVAASTTGLDELGNLLTAALREDAPAALRDGGYIADGHDPELDRLRNIGHQGHRFLAEFQAREIERTGIPTLKVGYNSVFGYYLEVTHQHREKVPPEYVRRQTVRNAERYITDELKRHENEVLGAADRARQLELELFERLRDRASQDLPRMQQAARAVATLDVLAALAELSLRRDYCRPEPVEAPADSGARPEQVLEIVDGRHPVLDAALRERFVPNDCKLSSGVDRLALITGPNMAGKSTYIRQVALLTLLAHTGSWVPAKKMRWSPVDRIFARVGASDELARGQSTFMVEMVETARILNGATAKSLIILDEIGRGTSTYDGLAIAWAVTEHLVQRLGCLALFATHYHELTELADRLDGAANFNVAVREELRPSGAGREVVFLHKIVAGGTDRSYGVHVAAMAGLPRTVVKRSEEVLAALEGEFSRKSGGRALSAGRPEPSGQLQLFSSSSPAPPWMQELVAALGGIDPNRTTPMEALAILSKLKQVARNDASESGEKGGG